MKRFLLICSLVISNTFRFATADLPCMKSEAHEGVCVCNKTYCDFLEPLVPQAGNFIHVMSDKQGNRFHVTNGQIQNCNSPSSILDLILNENVVIKINAAEKYQHIFGFGGAMTDAAAINIHSLSSDTQNNLMKSYFSTLGINYTFVRVPIGGCDFSTRPYDLNPVKDNFNLSEFNLTAEDFEHKIPLLKKAVSLNKDLKLFGSVWSAPPWMKTNNEYNGTGSLKPGDKYCETWANYFIKFLEAYKSNGLKFWGLTTQNEPTVGLTELTPGRWNCMGWFPKDQIPFIIKLSTALKESNFSEIKIIIFDDSTLFLVSYIKVILSDPEVRDIVSGIGFHWYSNFWFPVSFPLSVAKNLFPEIFILATEACTGAMTSRGVVLGSWERGEDYACDIIEDMNNWVVGWVDWNLALDVKGGPNWAENFVDSPIIVNETADEFYKQPMFYAMGHFSKFIPVGSRRIHHSCLNQKGLKILTVRAPGMTVIVILNKTETNQLVVIQDGEICIKISIDKHSLHTVMY